MGRRNAKTVRLHDGRHDSPEEGACVVELASMLADEPFTDKPASVSPVIREFLRDYNDDLDYRRRQDLHEVAVRVVGTAGDRAADRRRAQMCVEWVGEQCDASPPGQVPMWWVKLSGAFGRHQVAGAYAARAAACLASDQTHRAALDLVERMVAVGGGSQRRSEDAPVPSEVESDTVRHERPRSRVG